MLHPDDALASGPAPPLVVGIVDDVQEERALLRRMLRQGMPERRVIVREGATAEDAIALARGHQRDGTQNGTPERPLDVMLVDLNLAGGSGMDVLRALGSDPSLSIPVIVVTGSEMDAHVEEALREGAQDFVSKAKLTPRLITRALRYAVERHRLVDEVARSNAELEARVAERTKTLAAANALLEVQNRELEQFAFIASHDLHEPLRKIQMFTSLLKEETGDPEGSSTHHYAGRIDEAASRMRRLLHDLLRYASSSSSELVQETVDLDGLVRDVVRDLRVRIEQSGGDVEAQPLPQIDGDPVLLHSLLLNLVSNGLKYHREGEAPRVRVWAEERGDLVDLVVEDDGIGFDEKYLDRIFDPFERLHGRGEYGGSGIGLAIGRRVVERHGGEITAESEPGRGARFIVTLPLRQTHSQTHEAASVVA